MYASTAPAIAGCWQIRSCYQKMMEFSHNKTLSLKDFDLSRFSMIRVGFGLIEFWSVQLIFHHFIIITIVLAGIILFVIFVLLFVCVFPIQLQVNWSIYSILNTQYNTQKMCDLSTHRANTHNWTKTILSEARNFDWKKYMNDSF